MTKLPGVNYNVPLSINDLEFTETTYNEEFTSRMQAIMGELAAAGCYGIVDSVEPTQIASTELGRPLIVTTNTSNVVTVDINAGWAVTQSGYVVQNAAKQYQFSLARTVVGDVNIVFIEYATEDGSTNRLNRYNELLPVQRIRATDPVRVLLQSDFNNSTVVSPERRQNIVVLAYVTVVEGQTGTELSIDLSQIEHSDNRPWFSPHDIQHRNRVGSGATTDNNPHGIALNDLVTGGLTLYNQQINRGMVISKDVAVANVPGDQICTEFVVPTRVLTDTTGDITARSAVGGAGARYVRLLKYPTRFAGAYDTNSPGNGVAVDWIPHTNLIVLAPDEVVPTGGFTAVFTNVSALHPPVDPNINLLNFAQPTTASELVVSNGLALNAFLNPFVNFENSGPIPKDYYVFADQDGQLIKSPQQVLTATKLQDIGTTQREITVDMIDSAKIKIGLTKAADVSSMEIVIRINGLNDIGAVITEDLTFTGDTWSDTTTPAVGENPEQFVISENVYSELTTYQVLSRTDDGANSTIIMYADLESIVSPQLSQWARVALVRWDGLAVAAVEDWRTVGKDLNIPSRENMITAAAESNIVANMLLNTITTTPTVNQKSVVLFADDFRDPHYLDFGNANAAPSAATGSIVLADKDILTTGDQIQLRPGKVLTAVLSGADPTVGEYNFQGLAAADILTSMITAINDPTFNVDITAALGTGDSIDLVSDTLGAAGNGLITEPVEGNAGAILVSGMSGGYDSIGQVYLDIHDDGLQSMPYQIPSPATEDHRAYPKKYRSYAVAIPNEFTTAADFMIALWGVHGPAQVRVRAALKSDPLHWLPEVVLPAPTLSNQDYPVSFAGPVYKLQVTVFAENCKGVSVYLVTPNV